MIKCLTYCNTVNGSRPINKETIIHLSYRDILIVLHDTVFPYFTFIFTKCSYVKGNEIKEYEKYFNIHFIFSFDICWFAKFHICSVIWTYFQNTKIWHIIKITKLAQLRTQFSWYYFPIWMVISIRKQTKTELFNHKQSKLN